MQAPVLDSRTQAASLTQSLFALTIAPWHRFDGCVCAGCHLAYSRRGLQLQARVDWHGSPQEQHSREGGLQRNERPCKANTPGNRTATQLSWNVFASAHACMQQPRTCKEQLCSLTLCIQSTHACSTSQPRKSQTTTLLTLARWKSNSDSSSSAHANPDGKRRSCAHTVKTHQQAGCHLSLDTVSALAIPQSTVMQQCNNVCAAPCLG
jgi:hypothetical protein